MLPQPREPGQLPDRQVPRKIIGSRYFFTGAEGLGPVLVVAVHGGADDWAAYIAGVPLFASQDDEELQASVYRWGVKLTEDQATGFFPYIHTNRGYRR